MRLERPICAAAAAVVLLAGCSGGSAGSPSAGATRASVTAAPAETSAPSPTIPLPPTASPTAAGPASPSPAATVACVTSYAWAPGASPAEPAQLTDVRVGVHDGVDRAVFEFAGDAVPAFDIAPASPPFVQDASGLPVDVPGTAFLRIHFPFATGMATYGGPASFAGPGGAAGTMVSLVRTGDFEAVMSWVAGTRAPACVRVTFLGAPTRVVLDLSPAG